MASADGPSVALRAVDADYGPRPVLRDVSIAAGAGAVLALFGHNGAGKTTAVRIMAGLKTPAAGGVELLGRDARRLSAAARARAGLALVPEGVQGIFPTLTVEQNLQAARVPGVESGDGLDDWLVEAFGDVLVRRRRQVAGSMSGGQRQMLALSIALARRPKVLLLDEPSTGLAPRVVQRIFEVIGELAHRSEVAIVVVEQDIKAALSIATRVCVLQSGRVAAEFPASDCPPPTELWRLF